MINAEYIRNLNCNYERIMLEDCVDDKRYQYCILCRGGIKYLLPCSLRYINGETFLYYDISSTQNIKQLFSEKHIQREWMKQFFWSMQRMRIELNRFLLDEKNIIWSPEHIFQDLEKNDFLYLYMPYYGQEGHNEEGFEKLLDFWVEKIDYEDEALVEFIYHAYEKYHNAGPEYLVKQIFEDFAGMEDMLKAKETEKIRISETAAESGLPENSVYSDGLSDNRVSENGLPGSKLPDRDRFEQPLKKGLLSFWEGRKKRHEPKEDYREELRQLVNGYAVCEPSTYNEPEKERCEEPEEYGRTIYIEEAEQLETHGLYSEKGELAVLFSKYPFVIGKRKEDTDYALPDYSASRVHARFVAEEDGIYIEDLNSTNGTFKNGLRMQPYEKRKLETGDTLRFGKSAFVYK